MYNCRLEPCEHRSIQKLLVYVLTGIKCKTIVEYRNLYVKLGWVKETAVDVKAVSCGEQLKSIGGRNLVKVAKSNNFSSTANGSVRGGRACKIAIAMKK